MSGAKPRGSILALIDHPNLDILLGPVLLELAGRGHAVKALVTAAGRPGRLHAMGVPLVQENREFDAFIGDPGPRLFLNAADMIPQHRLGIQGDMVCRAAGIPSLTLEHAPFSLSYDRGFPPHVEFAADVMAVVGEADRQRYLDLGIAAERLVVTGCPAFDALVRAQRDFQGHQDNETARLDIAVFGQSHTWAGPGSSQGIPVDLWRDQLTLLYRTLCDRYPKGRLRIKPHPAEPFAGTEVLYHQAVPDDLRERVEVLPTQADNAGVILGSRFVISFSSTIWLEARILGRPCALLTLQERTGPLAADVASAGGIWIPGRSAFFVDRLLPSLEILDAQAESDDSDGATESDGVTESGVPAGWAAAILAGYTGPLDGRAAARVADAAERLLDAGAPRTPMPVLVFDAAHTLPRRLRPGRSYPDYVHLQAVADEAMDGGPEQPRILGLGPAATALREHLPLAFYTLHPEFPGKEVVLPFADGAFDAVAAPDLWTPDLWTSILREMVRVARRVVVTSAPTPEGLQQYRELSVLLDPAPDLGPAFRGAGVPLRAGDQDGGSHGDIGWDPNQFSAESCAESLARIEALLRAQPGRLRVRPCHQVMSWAQAIVLEQVGLDEAALGSLRSALQATGYPRESQGCCARTIFILHTQETASTP